MSEDLGVQIGLVDPARFAFTSWSVRANCRHESPLRTEHVRKDRLYSYVQTERHMGEPERKEKGRVVFKAISLSTLSVFSLPLPSV